jgi:hypothetical protein
VIADLEDEVNRLKAELKKFRLQYKKEEEHRKLWQESSKKKDIDVKALRDKFDADLDIER